MKIIFVLALVLACSIPAASIELSLEENRAERGSVGFVDMQRLFTNSPDAQRAKAGFEELVRQAEERVNLSKAELLKLRQDIAGRRSERDALAASISAAAPAPAVAPSTSAAAAAISTSAALSGLLAQGIALPGMSSSDAAPTTAPLSSSATVTVSTPIATSAPAPAALPAPPPAGPTFAQRLADLDAQILSLDADIRRKEADLAREHDEADHGLLDVESRKTDQVLVRLYRAITEVARRESVSVVVDKTTILYGHPAVDITGKVLQYLKEAPQQ